ncbi:hypothetical protein [Fulvivirga sp.]|uniref:hypothetical protein n=1 Tax=Fulvivirga sp. TaxID=1931237 RepID=UPI0032F01D62
MGYKVAVIAKTLSKLLVRLVNENKEFEAVGFTSVDEMDMKTIGDYDIALIAGGIENFEIKLVKGIILNNKLKTKLIEHYGGGSGLLLQELYDAINKK